MCPPRLKLSWSAAQQVHKLNRVPRRCASLTSAIERGRRKANAAIDKEWGGNAPKDGEGNTKSGLSLRDAERIVREIFPPHNAPENRRRQTAGRKIHIPDGHHNYVPASKANGESVPVKPTAKKTVPIRIPYTTSASVFLYGKFAVSAALKARRRRFYKLYVLKGEAADSERDVEIEKLARSADIWIENVGLDQSSVLNKMAKGRPHNGVVLEASPLPKLPIRALKSVKESSDSISVQLDDMSEEDRDINGDSPSIQRRLSTDRYPLVLLLDRVLDPGNLGAIIRSAYFLGVDAIVMSRSGSAPTSAVTVKASAGAAEAMPLLTANAPLDFVRKSKAEGWQVFAAVSPSSKTGQRRLDKFVSPVNALDHGPCLLVIGGEGEGIAKSIMQKITGYVGISQVRRDDGLDIVESLNVSVASAMMVQKFLRTSDTGQESSRLHPTGASNGMHEAVF